ncbi:MAG: NAD(P)-binding protein [Bacillota bacterium]|nr:NAD(P)-binding protein [Bacillota bacterium]
MKEVRDFYNEFDSCRMQDIPLCADACPFKMDILDVQERIEKKRFNAAYKSIRDCVVFPGIVAETCPAYCQNACIREGFGGAVQIRKLEQAVNTLAIRRDPNAYNLPKHSEKIAVVGGGISGMAFTLKMAGRKYDVTVFEAGDHIGGQLEELMDRDSYMAEFELQFKNESYELKLNAKADKTALLGEGFDVIYVATGKGGDDFGVTSGSEITERPDGGKALLLTGGSLNGRDLMHALADGIALSAAADDYLKSGVLNMPELAEPSKCVGNEDKLDDCAIVEPAGETYTEEEAIAEASRCIRCQCDGCESYCDLVEFYKKWPVKMRDELFLSVKPAGSLVHKSPARKYIAACTDCKIMEEYACPEHIELCGMIKAARHQMHAADKMPAAYKQYYIRDMEFANSPHAAVVKMGQGVGSSDPASDPASYAFFPGCSLGALNPDYVIKPYRWLRDTYPDAGLLLKCCGLPIDWAGNTEAHMESVNQLKADWESIGSPTLVTACMSCNRHLAEYLPEIPTVTIYELMGQRVGSSDPTDPTSGPFTVFDPCSARGDDEVQAAVRKLAASAGISTEELPKGDLHGCCGFGGQGAVAQPDFAKHVAEKRAGMSDNPYLVYCSNCRDVFTGQNKKAIHILDVLFDIDPDCTAKEPDVTQRRQNRSILKEKLLSEFWGEEMTDRPEELKYEITMSEEVRVKVNRARILTEDLANVIERAERTGRRTRNPESGHYKAYNEIGAITLWVEYGDFGANKREIFNVYSHRMQIKLEPVFNGNKVEE